MNKSTTSILLARVARSQSYQPLLHEKNFCHSKPKKDFFSWLKKPNNQKNLPKMVDGEGNLVSMLDFHDASARKKSSPQPRKVKNRTKAISDPQFVEKYETPKLVNLIYVHDDDLEVLNVPMKLSIEEKAIKVTTKHSPLGSDLKHPSPRYISSTGKYSEKSKRPIAKNIIIEDIEEYDSDYADISSNYIEASVTTSSMDVLDSFHAVSTDSNNDDEEYRDSVWQYNITSVPVKSPIYSVSSMGSESPNSSTSCSSLYSIASSADIDDYAEYKRKIDRHGNKFGYDF